MSFGVGHAGGDLRDRLIRVGRAVVAAGLVVGSGGNLSARSPGAGQFWVTGAGTWLDQLERRDFALVHVGAGSRAGMRDEVETTASDHHQDAAPAVAPTSELPLHQATYRARPDVNAIIHLHPQLAVMLDAVGEPIRLVTTDHAFYLRTVARVPFYPPGSAALAQATASASADGTNCLVLARHGCSVLADTIELAHKRALYLEEAAALTHHLLTLRGADTRLVTAVRALDDPWRCIPTGPYGAEGAGRFELNGPSVNSE